MHSNDLEACGKKCCYFWFYSKVSFYRGKCIDNRMLRVISSLRCCDASKQALCCESTLETLGDTGYFNFADGKCIDNRTLN